MDNLFKKNNQTKIFILTSIGVFLTVIITTVFLSLNSNQSSGSEKTPPELTMPPAPTETAALPYNKEATAVLTAVHLNSDTVFLLDTNTEETLTLQYSGGTNIRNKFDQIISAGQLSVGDIVDVQYNSSDEKISKIVISPNAWDYQGVTNLEIDSSIKKMTIVDSIYRYPESILVLDEGNAVPLSNLTLGDQLTVRGVENQIFVIILTRGHGYLTLEDDKDFVGGTIQVGGTLTDKITEQMMLKVKEGEYLVSVSHKQFKGEKIVKIERNQTTTLNLSEFGSSPVQMGRVNFSVFPQDADLFIDGTKTLHQTPVDVAYGDHTIEASLGGYVTYHGTLSVSSTETTYRITLPEGNNEPTKAPDDPALSPGITPNGSPAPSPSGSPSSSPNTGIPTPGNDNTSEITPTGTAPPNTQFPNPTAPTNPTNTPTSGTIADDGHSIIIKCTEGTKVSVNGEYAGTVQNGEAKFKKQIGKITFTLTLDGYITKYYTVIVENDKEDAIYTFPAMVSG